MRFTNTECTVYVPVPVRAHHVLEEAGDMGKGTARLIILHLSRMFISGASSAWTRAALTDCTQVTGNPLYL